MEMKTVLIFFLALAWTDGSIGAVHSSVYNSTVEMTSLLATLQERLSLSSDSLSLMTQALVRELEIQANRQSELESGFERLQSQLMTSAIGPAIAFSARARSNQGGLVRQQRINFQDMLTNIGGGYNNATSTFRCPVWGVYQFVVTILSEPNERIETELMAAGVTRMEIYSAGMTHHGSGTNSVLLELQTGDEVYVRLNRNFGRNVHHLWSTFNGHLVHKL